LYVTVYSADWCRHCSKVKSFLQNKNIDFDVVDIDSEPEKMMELISTHGAQTIPQVIIDGSLIGGCEDTIKFLS
jgi:glutaredoxin